MRWRKTVCKWGHKLSGYNRINYYGAIICRTCKNTANRRYRRNLRTGPLQLTLNDA